MKNIKDDEIIVRVSPPVLMKGEKVVLRGSPPLTDKEVLKAMENEDDFSEKIIEVIKANSKKIKELLK